MGDPQVFAFAVIAGLLTVTPGADPMLVIRNVMARGWAAGLLTTVGACCGLFVHVTLSALGLSLILIRSATAFEILKMIGAGYLIWLGIRSLTQALRGQQAGLALMGHPEPPPRPASGRRSFLEGLLSNSCLGGRPAASQLEDAGAFVAVPVVSGTGFDGS